MATCPFLSVLGRDLTECLGPGCQLYVEAHGFDELLGGQPGGWCGLVLPGPMRDKLHGPVPRGGGAAVASPLPASTPSPPPAALDPGRWPITEAAEAPGDEIPYRVVMDLATGENAAVLRRGLGALSDQHPAAAEFAEALAAAFSDLGIGDLGYEVEPAVASAGAIEWVCLGAAAARALCRRLSRTIPRSGRLRVLVLDGAVVVADGAPLSSEVGLALLRLADRS